MKTSIFLVAMILSCLTHQEIQATDEGLYEVFGKDIRPGGGRSGLKGRELGESSWSRDEYGHETEEGSHRRQPMMGGYRRRQMTGEYRSSSDQSGLQGNTRGRVYRNQDNGGKPLWY